MSKFRRLYHLVTLLYKDQIW